MANNNNINTITSLLTWLFFQVAGRDGYLLQGHRDGLHQVQQDQPGEHLRVSTYSIPCVSELGMVSMPRLCDTFDLFKSVSAKKWKKNSPNRNILIQEEIV